MEAGTQKTIWTIGAQLLALAIFLLVMFAIVWVASKAWKKGGESSYMVDNNAKGFTYGS